MKEGDNLLISFQYRDAQPMDVAQNVAAMEILMIMENLIKST
jgi:hypothetical protein